jgi:type I restriction enzyme, S subunit
MELKAGYKSTELGVLPVDWKVQTIESVMSEISMGPFGSDIKVSNFVAFGVPVLSGLNVRSERLLDSFTNFVTPEKAKDLKKAVARRGDVVITHRGTLGQISYIPVDSEFDRYVISQSQFRVRFNLSAVLPNWIALYFLSPLGSAKLLEGKGHTGVPALAQATTKFRQLHIPLPSLDEQRAIATALSDVDALIAGLEKLIAKKRDLKQAAMQQLLTGQTRLPGFSGEWLVINLGHVATFLKGKGLPKSALTSDGVDSCIHYGELFTHYAETVGEITSRTNGTRDSLRSVANDVLMPTSDVTPRGLAKASCVTLDNVILGGDILVIRSDPSRVFGAFLSYVIRREEDQVLRLVTGSTVYHLYGSDMKKFKFALPSVPEQIAISSLLSEMDAELTTLESRLAKTRDLKQGMMQELLTGRTRLV